MLVVPALLSRLFSVCYITEINGTIEEEMIIDKSRKFMVKIAVSIENFCYLVAKKIITTNEGLKDYLIKKYNISPLKIEIIGMGVDTNRFLPGNKSFLRKKLNFLSNSYYLGYIGGLQQWQGLNYLVKSMKIIIKKIPNCKLLIVGDGPEKENLINLTKRLKLEDDIYFINSVKHELLSDYINMIDVCVCYLDKFKEGRYGPPTKVYEYMACEKPVILSNIKGMKELFGNHVIYVKPEEETDLAEKIIYLLKRPKLRETLSKKGRSFVLNGYSWGDVVKKTLNVFKQVIKEKKKITF
jgi:glycosyltransferase involved in cell wall biosynthesis